jgi:starch synthase (maltosyl-transferring)
VQPEEGRRRVVITTVEPEVDSGRFPIKRAVGEGVVVEADIFADGHEAIAGTLRYHRDEEDAWTEVPMAPAGNDRWYAEFQVTEPGRYRYSISAWIDYFQSWRQDLAKRNEPQDIATALLAGTALIEEAAQRATRDDAVRLRAFAEGLRGQKSLASRRRRAMDDDLAAIMTRYPDRHLTTVYQKELEVIVDPERARFSTWYEMFPRSCAPSRGQHGTFKDCEARLRYIAAMGFDVLYLPPIHPIGHTHRKGRNNALQAGPEDPGSPWAIGAEEGGHKAVHPALGTLDDLGRLSKKASELGIALALDIALQCSPDHPYVREHPEWFRRRPDGTVQYAENPPKKYQDIYPLCFETESWRPLWDELRDVFLFWIGQGIRIFRVDNPHTKPFAFWEWLIDDIKKAHPEVILLSEAFTRPKVMHRLAKLGFTQSYTYFTWRNTKAELISYFTELTKADSQQYFRPSLWPNTPDILTEYLQFGGRPAFIARLFLAATLSPNYGIYGPAFELCENRAREAGSEEYLDSEKYEVRHWEIDRPDSLRDLIARVNWIRQDNPALQRGRNLCFYPLDNDELICYGRWTDDFTNVLVIVVNLDPHHTRSGWVELPLTDLAIDPRDPYQAHDLVSDARYLWHGARNYVEIDPEIMPAHVLRLRRRLRSERDFDYFV